MVKKICLSLTLVMSSLLLFAQAKLIEKVTKKGSEVLIPYEKYQFPNGLTLLVHEDHSDPIVHVDVTYHVGSAREEIGKSGFAHFFEHMMFQGSDHVGDEQHFKIITEAGGTLNGTTNRDRTNYFETVPSNQLEKMLWLESDRMGFLLDAVTQQKFEVQRATVKNERGQNYDNRPYGLVQETISRNLYPYGHPYSWLTIGYVEDLNRVNVQDLKNFFLRWYGPNNAVVSIGGDVNTKDVVALVDKYFGKIPKGPEPGKFDYATPTLDKDRYVTLVDGYAKIPTIVCTFPSVYTYHYDEPALDCLAEIIGGSNSSILYKNMVKTQKATRASCSNFTDELAGTFQINVMPKSGTNLADAEKEIRSALAEFEQRGVSDDDLEKIKNSIEARQIYGLESVSGKVSQLAAYQTFTGNANYILDDLARYKNVTKQDVIRVYNQYIKNKPMVILSVVTKGTEALAAAKDNYKVDEKGYKAPDYGYSKLKYQKTNDFDRSVMPKAGPAVVTKVPAFKKLELVQDKMNVISAASTELPVVVVQLALKGGRLPEQNELSKVGLAELFVQMMDEDTKRHTAEEINTMTEKLGTMISFNSNLDETVVSMRCLKKNLKASLDLLEEKLTQPLFKQEAFDRIKGKMLEDLKNSRTRAAVVASNAYARVNYGAGNILGFPSNGLIPSVMNITLKDVEDYYSKYISKEDARIVVVGDITDKETLDIVGRFSKLPAKKIDIPDLSGIKPRMMTNTNELKTIYLCDIPKAAQTEFRIGYVTNLKYDATGDYYKSGLMNFPLGGAFNSRINLNLRENKGWTYGARSNFSGNNVSGEYTFSSGIRTPATDSALVEVIKEISNYQKNGITNEELSFMKNSIGQSEARKYETGFQKAAFLSNLLKYNLSDDYVTDQNKILKDIKVNEINDLAKKWLNLNAFKIVLAGDKEKIAAPLEKAGYTIVYLDSDGELKK